MNTFLTNLIRNSWACTLITELSGLRSKAVMPICLYYLSMKILAKEHKDAKHKNSLSTNPKVL